MATSKKLAIPLTVQGGAKLPPVNVNVSNDPLDVNIKNDDPLLVNVDNMPGNINVTLNNTPPVVNPSTQINDSANLRNVVQNRANVFGFNAFKGLMDNIFRAVPVKPASAFGATGTTTGNYISPAEIASIASRPLISITGSYDLLKAATERYVSRVFDSGNNTPVPFANSGSPVNPANNSYIDLITDRINEFFKTNSVVAQSQLRTKPVLLELIWNYWHEEGMLVQSMHAIARRFQNISNGGRDPLANMETDPLRPLNNILWGYIQDSLQRLTVQRRTLEYEHEYGLKLIGKAVNNITAADRRSEFLFVFHDLLNKCSILFKESDDRTRTPDGFPVLHALKSVHLTLSEGAHNQFGDLPMTARVEMLIEQWILSQPEVREFLGGRVMVPFRETWMDRVDSMKAMQGWPSPSVSYYNDLARFGEQLLLHIRWTSWTQIDDPNFATQWAIDWRPVIQGYIHAYNVVTNVDLSADATSSQKSRYKLLPSFLIQQKYQQERLLKQG